jgi:hypothetical protein
MLTYFLYQIEYVGSDVAYTSEFLDICSSDFLKWISNRGVILHMNFHYNSGPKFSSDIANSKNLTFRFQRTLS